MNKNLLLLIFLICSVYSKGQNSAFITFDSLTINYGKILQGENGTVDFKFTNTGDRDLKINRVRHELSHFGNKVHLAKKEFKLLYYLMSVPGKVFSREDIIFNVWGDTFVGDRTIDVHIRKIREKIGENYIKTVKGVGYKFDI